jgi:SAM-dependent methyltransferase
MPTQPDVDIWALSDLCTPWCVHVVATLGVADRIAEGLNQIDDIANAVGADASSLHRVLRHLAGHGVFEEASPGVFVLNGPARQLLEPPIKIGMNLDSFGGRMANAWSGLLQSVRSGRSAYSAVFGRQFWEDLAAHPEISAAFDDLMGPDGHGVPDADVLVTGTWDSIHSVVDVGGGTGTLLSEILRAHPTIHGTLVDLPDTVGRSEQVFRQAGVTGQVTLVAQSFFKPLPSGADLYLLKSVLSDWPDPEAIHILRTCADAARPSGRVLLLNGVSPDEDHGPPPDLLMLILVGGRARTLSELQMLASEAGLEVSATIRQTSGRFVVECVPL